jgi:hypothetical protein
VRFWFTSPRPLLQRERLNCFGERGRLDRSEALLCRPWKAIHGLRPTLCALFRSLRLLLGRILQSGGPFSASRRKFWQFTTAHYRSGQNRRRLAGETPARATGTVALPNPLASSSFRFARLGFGATECDQCQHLATGKFCRFARTQQYPMSKNRCAITTHQYITTH